MQKGIQKSTEGTKRLCVWGVEAQKAEQAQEQLLKFVFPCGSKVDGIQTGAQLRVVQHACLGILSGALLGQ